jgi:pyruvate,water dikinase
MPSPRRRGSGRRTAALVALFCAIACERRPSSVPGADAGTPSTPDHPGNSSDAGDRPDRPGFLERLDSVADYGLLQGEGGEVKFLGGIAGKTPPAPGLDRACLFLNTQRYAGHITYLRSLPGMSDLDFTSYLSMVMKRASRVLWGGSLKYYPGEPHPRTGAQGILAYFLYSDPNDVDALTADEIAELDARLKSCVPYARDLLALVGMDADQAIRFEAQRSTLTERGVSLVDLRKLHQGVAAEGYVIGEGYGYLKVVPAGATLGDYGPRDVLVLPSAPQDLALVAGLVTATPQNLHSHVNLRLGAKRIPSAFVSDIYQNQVVTQLAGRLVHIAAIASAIQIDPAPLEAAEAFWGARRPAVPPPAADLGAADLRPFDSLTAADAPAFGTKAANLGELHRILPASNRTEGFGVPFSAYRDFMAAMGHQAAVDALLADPRTGADASFRDAQLAALASRIEDAAVPADLVERLQAAARAAFGEGFATLPLKLRSSSNAEDGPVVSGAGIYDSARGCFADDLDGDSVGPSACLSADERQALEAQLAAREAELKAHPERTWLVDAIHELRNDLTKERGVARALKKVYASLWSRRAFEERAYWGIDQHSVYMGVAIEPSFVLERLNAVAVTNLTSSASGTAAGGDAGLPLYRVVSQVGSESVVRPTDPSAVAETMLFARNSDDSAADVRWLTHSSLTPDPLWSDARIHGLASLLFLVHDHFATAVYPGLTHPSLDIELKLTADDRIVVKQARPYVEPFTP